MRSGAGRPTFSTYGYLNPKRQSIEMKPYRSEKYKAWIRKQPCASCGRPPQHYPIHAHHEPLGKNSVGGKPPDTHLLPLCYECHAKRHNQGPAFLNSVLDVKMTIIHHLTRYLGGSE